MKKGRKYNKLTFIKEVDPVIRTNGQKRRRALFKCDCGDVKEYSYHAVKGGHSKRCVKCAYKVISEKKIKHNLKDHKLYRKWQDMKKRCYNPNVDRYKNYGGRGIKVCNEWKNDFKKFYDWCISKGWNEKLTLDRIDINKDYFPENCRLITILEQGFNKTNTYKVKYKEYTLGLSEVLYRNNMSYRYGMIWQGIKRGREFEHYVTKLNLNIDINELNLF